MNAGRKILKRMLNKSSSAQNSQDDITIKEQLMQNSVRDSNLKKNTTQYLEYEANLPVSARSTCELCGKFRSHSMIECRICDRVFHWKCLQNLKWPLQSPNWTCPACESLWNLLPEEEVTELLYLPLGMKITREIFEKMWPLEIKHNQRDETGEKTLGGFLQGRGKGSSKSGSKKKQEALENKINKIRTYGEHKCVLYEVFEELDYDRQGYIDQKVFKVALCLALLTKKSKMEILSYLTPKEVNGLRQCFSSMDPEKKGILNSEDAIRASSIWMKRYRVDSVEASKCIMNMKLKTNTFVTWSIFLLQHCLNALALRMNCPNDKDFLWLVNDFK